jgi:energy-coupling factor transporter ATP-binding protein EcfA2
MLQNEVCNSSTNPIIEMNHVSFRYDARNGGGIVDASLKVQCGEHVVLLGASGSGKSTLLRLLARLEQPQDGELTIAGRVAFVQQDPLAQIVGATVLEDVQFGPLNLGHSPTEAASLATHALATVGAAHLTSRLPTQLSYGELQLVALAGALAMKPNLLLLDEPFAHLDTLHRQHLMQVIHELVSSGITVIEATHAFNGLRQAQRIILLRQGRIIVQGAPAAVLRERRTLQTVGILPSIKSRTPQEPPIEPSVKSMSGNESVPLAEFQALKQPLVRCYPGDCVAIVGPTGSGKTSLLLSLIGLDPAGLPLRGTAKTGYWQVHTKRLGVLLQQPERHFWGQSIGEELSTGLLPTHKATAYLQPEVREWVEAQLLQVGLAVELAERHINSLSDGEQRRAALALALAGQPALLIADDPFVGLDRPTALLVERVLQTYISNGGCLVFVTNQSRWPRRLAKTCIALDNQQVTYVGDCREFYQSSQRLINAGLQASQADSALRTEV